MSGALASLFEELFQAEWRGIPFHIPDAREETGRRATRFLFPGRDDAIHEDLGALDGAIRISGIVFGEDYIRRANRLREAFREPGPGLLVHPWFGPLEVVLAEPAEISFSQGELRLARISATFEPFVQRLLPPQDVFSRLLATLDALREAARAALRIALAPLRLAVGLVGAVAAFAGGFVATFRLAVAAARGAPAILRDLTAPFESLAAIGVLPAGAGYADAVAFRLAAPSSAVLRAGLPAPSPAIGAFVPSAATAPAIGPADAARLLLAAEQGVARPGPAAPVTGPAALGLAARALLLADAAALAARIPFESRAEALGWRDRLDAAMARLAADAAAAAATDAAGAGGLWREAGAGRAAVARDLSERAARLPDLRLLALPRAAPTWLVAQHLSGDGDVAARHLELVRRNRPRRAGLMLAGPVEFLG